MIDKQDHQAVQNELVKSVPTHGDDERLFLCRMNVSRNARRQMRFGDQKVCLWCIYGYGFNLYDTLGLIPNGDYLCAVVTGILYRAKVTSVKVFFWWLLYWFLVANELEYFCAAFPVIRWRIGIWFREWPWPCLGRVCFRTRPVVDELEGLGKKEVVERGGNSELRINVK